MTPRNHEISLEPADQVALTILREVWRDWRFATDAIAATFRRNRTLSSESRRRVAEWVYGMVRMHRHVDEVVAASLRPLGRRPSDYSEREIASLRFITYLVLFEPSEKARAETRLREAGFEPTALLRASQALARDLGRYLSYPDWLVARVQSELGQDEAARLLEALNVRAPLCIRANTLKISALDLAERLAKEQVVARPLPLAQHGLALDVHPNVFGLPSFQEGLFEVQDEASQLVIDVCAVPPGGTVIDACAGAGGKTLGLGAALGGKGRVVALDVDRRKLAALGVRSRRAGLTNVQAIHVDDVVPPSLEARGDRVLVDAPCSGLGALRRNPEARWRLQPAEVDTFPGRQLALLERYSRLVASQGRLVYATCTFLQPENDGVVAQFAARNPQFEPVPIKEILGSEVAERMGDGTYLRTLPHRHGCDGFFAAVFRLRGTRSTTGQ